MREKPVRDEPPPPWVETMYIDGTTYCRYCNGIQEDGHASDCWWNKR